MVNLRRKENGKFKVLIVSPLGFAINALTRYAGIEKLAWQFSQVLAQTQDVTLQAHQDTIPPEGVKFLPCDCKGREIFVESELNAYQTYSGQLRSFDVIHDFSHQHFASRLNANLPSLNLFWHAPNEVQYPKSPYNIIGLSQWACRTFERYYHQKARFQETIAIDVDVYRPGAWRGQRFLTLGRMAKEKGNLEAAILCKEAEVPLDICGADSDPEYKAEILKLCDGKQIIYRGEISDEQKIHLMQTCRALIYVLDRPEVTNHKVQECMLCGAPAITGNIGALPEIVANGVNGYLCSSGQEYLKAIRDVYKLNPKAKLGELRQRYSLPNVVQNYLPLYESVAKGERW